MLLRLTPVPVGKPASFWGFASRDQEQDLELHLSLGIRLKDKVGGVHFIILVFWKVSSHGSLFSVCRDKTSVTRQWVQGAPGDDRPCGLRRCENRGGWLNTGGALLPLEGFFYCRDNSCWRWAFQTGSITGGDKWLQQCRDIHFRRK